MGNSKNNHLPIEVNLFLYETTLNIFTEQSWNFISLEILQHNITAFIYNHIPLGYSQHDYYSFLSVSRIKPQFISMV